MGLGKQVSYCHNLQGIEHVHNIGSMLGGGVGLVSITSVALFHSKDARQKPNIQCSELIWQGEGLSLSHV